MMINNRFSLYLVAFLIISFFFLALPEKGISGINFGCCLSPPNGTTNCIGCLTDCTTSEAFCLSQGGIPDSALDNELCLADEIGNNAVCGSFEGNNTGCCVFDTESANCQDNLSDEQCFNEGLVAELWFVQTPCSEVTQCVQPPRNIPTLSQWGLVAIAGILGIVGFMVLRRRSASA